MIWASRRSLLLNHPDRSTRDRAKALFGDAVSKSRNEVIQRYKAALSLTGDLGRGHQVFERVCAACHRIRDKGNDIGPNLSSYGQPSTSPQSLLTDILDPNRQVSPEYVSYVVVLNDGRVLSGILATQTPNSVTLKREKDGDGMVILRNNIEEMKSSGKSLMPEGLEQNVSVEEMADLLSFLMAIRKQI
jgi:putative heme-binding domain-containing protein